MHLAWQLDRDLRKDQAIGIAVSNQLEWFTFALHTDAMIQSGAIFVVQASGLQSGIHGQAGRLHHNLCTT